MNTKYEWGKLVIKDRRRNKPQKENKSLRSVLETTEVDSLIEAAEIVEYDFQQNTSIREMTKTEVDMENELIIPVKPSSKLSREEYKNEERKQFNVWKLKMNNLLSTCGTLTPYERNLHVWRQLWFTAENSDVIVQIVDARNPLLFYNRDIEKIYKEKEHLLLLNKSDLLNERQKKKWAEYMDKKGIKYMFYSTFVPEDTNRLMEALTHNREKVTIGMIGYPNVGKSSTINAMFAKKVVKTSIVPGKTKSIQTLEMTDNITLCDCPGLVFPSFVTVKQDLILNGILSLDHTREVKECLEIIIERVGIRALCYVLGVKDFVNDSRKSTTENFVDALKKTTGCVEEGKLIKSVIKDYIEGIIKYVHVPPCMEDAKDIEKYNANNYDIPDAYTVDLEKSYKWRESESKTEEKAEMSKEELMYTKKHYLRKGLTRKFRQK